MGQGLRRPRRRSSAIQQAVEQLETRVLLADVFGNFFVAPPSAAPGSTFDITYQIANGGPGDTPSFHVNFYLSNNGVISGSDILLGGADLSVAGNGSSGLQTKSVTLPAGSDPFWTGLTNNTYFIGMVLDTNNTVAETNENNNANGGQGLDRDDVLVPPTMDVFGDFFDAPASASPGTIIGVTYQIRNAGTAATPTFHVSWYLSSDSNITTSDILLDGIDTSVGANTNTGHQAKSLTLPGVSDAFWHGTSTYYIGMLVDTGSAVDETNEDNNSNRGQALDLKSLTMSPMDLLGTFLDAPAMGAPGGTIDVTYEVSNGGAGATPDFHVDWYLSDNDTISPSDFLVGTTTLNLAGSANTGHLLKSVTLPAANDPFWAGVNRTYYLGMIIDGDGAVAETNENNNKNRGLVLDRLDRDSLLIDGTAPTVTLFPITAPTAGATAGFFVTYGDNVGVKFSTVGNGDIRVTGPNGFSELATLVSALPVGDSASTTAVYSIIAPDGGWDSSDNGIYTVSIVAGQVHDSADNSVAAGSIGTFTVNIAATPPTIASLSHTPEPVTRPTDLVLTANTVAAPGSTISTVEFYRDTNNNGILDIGADTLVGTGTESSGNWSFPAPTLGLPVGNNRYFARAQNTDGFWSNVVSTTAIVNNAKPAIASLSGPADDITRGDNITLTAHTVSDADGTISEVDFYRDGNGNGTLEVGTDVLLGTGTNASGDWSWTGSSAAFALGTNKYFARAQDNHATFSDVVNTTGNAKNAAPVVGSLTGAPNPVPRGTTLTLTANNVVDVDGTIAKVEFYRDINGDGLLNLGTSDPNVPPDILLGADTNSAEGWTMAGTANFPLGVNKYLARATDNLGLVSAVTAGSVTIENAAPAIDSLSAAPDPVFRGKNITLTADGVTDGDGVVAKVEFYLDTDNDGVLDLPTANPSDPHDQFLDNDLSPGNGWTLSTNTTTFLLGVNHFLARATDNEGATSATVAITATVNDAPPTISALVDTPHLTTSGKDFTLTATNVADDDTVAKVEFWRDSNGNGTLEVDGDHPDTLVGTDLSATAGWSVNVSPGSLPAGTYRYFARAQDNKDVWSATVALSPGHVIANPCPVSGTLFNDVNGNGRKDAREGALSNWRVYIDQDRDGRFDANEPSILTDKRGRWTLTPGLFGTHVIRTTLKRGWKNTAPKSGALIMKVINPGCFANQLFGVKHI